MWSSSIGFLSIFPLSQLKLMTESRGGSSDFRPISYILSHQGTILRFCSSSQPINNSCLCPMALTLKWPNPVEFRANVGSKCLKCPLICFRPIPKRFYNQNNGWEETESKCVARGGRRNLRVPSVPWSHQGPTCFPLLQRTWALPKMQETTQSTREALSSL